MLSIFLFHLANGPILPAVALVVKKLGGPDKWMTATVLTAQVVLPLRIASYSPVSTPAALVWLQGLDGIGAGIYGVAVAALSADLGPFATARAVGGCVGPVLSGMMVQHLGFRFTFYVFAAIAGFGAAVFMRFVPETGFRPQ